jgi:hypothetical protein
MVKSFDVGTGRLESETGYASMIKALTHTNQVFPLNRSSPVALIVLSKIGLQPPKANAHNGIYNMQPRKKKKISRMKSLCSLFSLGGSRCTAQPS